MYKRLLIAAASLCFSVLAHAQVTVNANDSFGVIILSSSGTKLAAGSSVRIGSIPSVDLAAFQSSNSYSTLNSFFTPIGEGTLPSVSGTLSETGTPVGNSNTMFVNNGGGLNVAGSFLGSFSVPAGYMTLNTPLYLWVFNSSDPSTATQWAVFGDASWTFPSNLGTASLTMTSSGINVIRGSTNGSNYDLANIPAVPEPTTISLLASAVVMGGVALRRRK
jgi:hypothetical protein